MEDGGSIQQKAPSLRVGEAISFQTWQPVKQQDKLQTHLLPVARGGLEMRGTTAEMVGEGGRRESRGIISSVRGSNEEHK